eukprot:Opistho-2@12204
MATLITFRNMSIFSSAVHVAYGLPALFSPKTFLRLIGSADTPANVRSLAEYVPLSGVYFLGVGGIFYSVVDSTDIVLQRRLSGLAIAWTIGNIVTGLQRHKKTKRWNPLGFNSTTMSVIGCNIPYLFAYIYLYYTLS